MVRWVGPGLAWVVRVGLGGPCRWAGGVVGWMQERYAGWIRGALAHPVWVMAGVGLCLWLTWQVGRRLETELLPEVHQGEFTVEVDLPVGTPLEGTVAALTAMEAVIRDDSPEVETVLAAYGFDATNIKRSDEGENTARFKVVLRPGGDPVGVEERVLGRVRERFAGIPDASVRVVKPVLFSAERPIVVELQGDDLTELREVSERVREALAGLPGLADVEATLRRGAPEIQVVYHRDRLALYGLNIGAVARQVRDLVQGNEATRFNMKDRRIPVRVRLEEGDRAQVEDVGRLLVDVGGDRGIPLSSVAALEVGEGPSEIRRVDGQRVAVIRAGVGEGTLGGAVEGIRSVLGGGVRLPAGVGYAIRGQNEEWERSRGSLLLALGLSLFLVYVVMASQFESLVQPLIIMASIPLAFFGSAMGLAVTGTAISVVVFLGLIVLAGIVVNNAIVLVDCANQNRARGMETGEAVAAAGRVRLRPILLTTGTTVLGLMPMALGLGEGAEIRTPLALTVMFGLASSTLLTLVVIPVVYAVTVRWQARWFGGWEEDMGDGRAN